MKKRSILALIVAVVMIVSVFGLAACGNKAAAPEPAAPEAPAEAPPAAVEEAAQDAVQGDLPTGLRTAYYVSTLNNAYHQGDANWAIKYGKEAYGIEITIMDGKSDTQVMAENAELTLAGAYDMCSWFVWNGDTIAPTVQECLDGGMTSNMFYQDLGPNIDIPFIYVIESKAATEMGVVAATQWKKFYPDKPIKFAQIGWMENDTVLKERRLPFTEGVMSVDPTAELVAELDAGAGTEAAYAVAQDLLQSNPDVNIIYAHSNDLVIGVMKALREAGRGKAEDGVPLTEIVISVDAPEQEIIEIFDPTSSLKITMSMTPKDNAIARLDNLVDIRLGNIPQFERLIINTYDVKIDFWNTPPQEALDFHNDQYMNNLTMADLGM